MLKHVALYRYGFVFLVLLSSEAMADSVVTPAVPAQQTQTASDSTSYVSPYQLRLTYTGEAWDNAEGGYARGSTYLSNVDAQLNVDAGRAFGWTGGRAVFEGFYQSYNSPNQKYVRSPVQDPSIIDTQNVEMFRLYQAYYDQDFGKTDVLVGMYDPAQDFVTLRPAGLFFNGGEALPAAIQSTGGQISSGASNGYPYYPVDAIGARVRQTLDDQWSVEGGVFDGTGDNPNHPGVNEVLINKSVGALLIGEVDYTPKPRTKLMAGAVYYTGKFDVLNETNPDGSVRRVYGTGGGYVGGNTRLYTQEGRRGLDGFMEIAFSDPSVNQITRSYSAGLTYTGWLDARPEDKFGIVTNIATNSDPYRKAQSTAGTPAYLNETNFEMTYRAPINSWLSVQPDIQYWIHPAYDPTVKNDLLFGFHFEIGHAFGL